MGDRLDLQRRHVGVRTYDENETDLFLCRSPAFASGQPPRVPRPPAVSISRTGPGATAVLHTVRAAGRTPNPTPPESGAGGRPHLPAASCRLQAGPHRLGAQSRDVGKVAVSA